VPPEAADQELIPTTTAKPDVAPAIDTTPPAETGKGLMSRRLDGKDGTTATKEYKLSKDELIEQAKEMFPNNPVAAAAFIATVEAESAGGKDMTENGYTKRQAIKKFVEPYKGSDGKLGPKMKARKDAIEKAKSSAEIFEIVYGGGPTGNKNLGNTELGDGFRFIGRGPIQLTGRANYEKYGKRAGYDIVNNPELMATNQEVSMAVTKEYLKDKGIDSVQKARDLYNVIGHSGGMKEAAKRWENVKKLYESTYGYDWDRAFSPRPMLRPTE
jgi:predicted chitinase